jgi:hypothetical protein
MILLVCIILPRLCSVTALVSCKTLFGTHARAPARSWYKLGGVYEDISTPFISAHRVLAVYGHQPLQPRGYYLPIRVNALYDKVGWPLDLAVGGASWQ